MWILFVFVLVDGVLGQGFDSFQTLPEIPGYEEVTQKPSESIGALEKCGEGADEGRRICVPYYMCDPITNTVKVTGTTDGFGIIDIRFGANACNSYLDVCCKVPTDTPPVPTDIPPVPTDIPPVITDVPPVTRPPVITDVPPVTRPPVTGPPSPTPPTHRPTPTSTDRVTIGSCGIRNDNGIDFKITGNNHNEAEYGEFPWMVAILKKDYRPEIDPVLAVCGGSLIAPNVVLTGAHCVYKYKTNQLKVRAGEWDTQTTRERLPYQERDIVDIIVHEDFNPQTLFNDFALVVLATPFDLAEHIGSICLPDQGEVIDSRNCFASGWGKNVFGVEGQYQVILKKIELPVVLHNQCQESLRKTRLGRHFLLDQSFICAGGEQGKDTCTGDGGSPLVCPDPKNPTRYVQTGIVAWGIGCGENNIPGVYADVAKFRNWIDTNIQRLNLDTSSYSV